MTDVQSEAADSNAQHAEVQPAESVQTPQLAGNPAVLGLMVFATGSLVLEAGSNRHSSTLRSTTNAPGILPSIARWLSGRMSTSIASVVSAAS